MGDRSGSVSPNPHDSIKLPERPKLLEALGPGLITGASEFCELE